MTSILITPKDEKEYAFVMEFLKKTKIKALSQSAWDQAIAEGAVTADEFFDELDERIKARFRA